MSQQQQLRRRRAPPEPDVRLGNFFDVAAGREKDFELDMDAAKFTAAKGQAGNRLGGPAGPSDGFAGLGGVTSFNMGGSVVCFDPPLSASSALSVSWNGAGAATLEVRDGAATAWRVELPTSPSVCHLNTSTGAVCFLGRVVEPEARRVGRP